VICAAYKDSGNGLIVLEAVTLTAMVFLSLTAYCFYTKKDFSFLGAGLFCSLFVLFLCGLFAAVFPSLFGGIGQTLYAAAGTIIFSLYILYDTSMIINRLGPDEYIIAAIDLYLDIINLFLMILRLLGSRAD